jgi:hypothetical protein
MPNHQVHVFAYKYHTIDSPKILPVVHIDLQKEIIFFSSILHEE